MSEGSGWCITESIRVTASMGNSIGTAHIKRTMDLEATVL